MEGWMPLFFPKDFVKTHIGITTENFLLGDDELLKLGKQVTILRNTIRQNAETIAREHGEMMEHSPKEVDEAVKKVQNRSATRIAKVKLFDQH